MAAEVITLTYKADLDDLRKTLATLPGTSKKEAMAAAKAIEKQFNKAEKAMGKLAKKIGKQQSKAAKATARAWGKWQDDLKRGAAAAFGDIVNKVADIGAGVVALGPIGGTAAVGLAAIGTALVGGAVAAAVATTAVIGLFVAVNTLIEKTEHLRDVPGFGITDDDVQRVSRINDGFTAVTHIMAQMAIDMATTLAPVVEKVVTLLVAAGLAGKDAFGVIAQATFALNEAIGANLDPFIQKMLDVAEVGVLAARTLGIAVPKGVDTLIASLRESSSSLDKMEAAFVFLTDVGGGYVEAAEKMIDIEGRHRVSLENQKAATNAAADALKNLIDMANQDIATTAKLTQIRNAATDAVLEGEDAIEARRQRALDQVIEMALELGGHEAEALEAHRAINAQFDQEVLDHRIATEDAYAKKVAATAKQVESIRARVTAMAIKAAGDLSAVILTGIANRTQARIDELTLDTKMNDARIEFLGKLEKKRKREMIAAFVAQKLAAVAQAVITGAALVPTLTLQLGVPAGPIAAIALTVASLATIAAQGVPKFHEGGMVSPDEVPMTGLAGEFMMSRGAVRGNEQAMSEINRTGEVPAADPGRFVFEVDGDQWEDMVVRRADGDGPLGALFRSKSPGITRGYGSG